MPRFAILVHFGDSDFGAKYQSLVDNIAQWRATAGRVESVDLRFGREAVVNPDTNGVRAACGACREAVERNEIGGETMA